jgi:hypothetical protein
LILIISVLLPGCAYSSNSSRYVLSPWNVALLTVLAIHGGTGKHIYDNDLHENKISYMVRSQKITIVV